jgi:hypothetical protein
MNISSVSLLRNRAIVKLSLIDTQLAPKQYSRQRFSGPSVLQQFDCQSYSSTIDCSSMSTYQSESISGHCMLLRLSSLRFTFASSSPPFSPVCKWYQRYSILGFGANSASRPVTEYWHFPSVGRCLEEGISLTILSALNTLSEVIVAVLPIPVIFHLNMDRKTRWTVISLLCLGYLVGIVGIIRTVFGYIVFDTDDLTWWAAPYWMASEIEISVAMVCASAPVLRPVLGRLAQRYHLARSALITSFQNRNLSHLRSLKSRDQTSNSNHISSYSTYWRPIDVEGIGVDSYGYTVTIIAGPNTQRPKTGRNGKSKTTSDPEKAEIQQEEGNDGVEQPKPALLRRYLTLGGRLRFEKASWRSWMRRSEVSRAPIEVTARQSIEIIEERIIEDDIVSESSAYSPKPATLQSLLQEPNYRSFFLENDIDD